MWNIEEDGSEGGYSGREELEINFSIFPNSSSPGLGHLSYRSVSPQSSVIQWTLSKYITLITRQTGNIGETYFVTFKTFTNILLFKYKTNKKLRKIPPEYYTFTCSWVSFYLFYNNHPMHAMIYDNDGEIFIFKIKIEL